MYIIFRKSYRWLQLFSDQRIYIHRLPRPMLICTNIALFFIFIFTRLLVFVQISYEIFREKYELHKQANPELATKDSFARDTS